MIVDGEHFGWHTIFPFCSLSLALKFWVATSTRIIPSSSPSSCDARVCVVSTQDQSGFHVPLSRGSVLDYSTTIRHVSKVVWKERLYVYNLTRTYKGKYFSFTNVGSSGCNIISTISPRAPFVTRTWSRSVWSLKLDPWLSCQSRFPLQQGGRLTFILSCSISCCYTITLRQAEFFFHLCDPLQYIRKVLFSCLDSAYGLTVMPRSIVFGQSTGIGLVSTRISIDSMGR